MLNTYEKLISDLLKYPNSTLNVKLSKITNLIDIKKMANDDPIFFHYFIRNITHQSDDDTIFTVNSYNSIKKINPDIGKKLIDLISLKKQKITNHIMNIDLSKPKIKDIEKYIIETKKKGEVSFSYDFIDLTHDLEKSYGISFHNIYGSIKHQSIVEILKNEFNLTDEEIKLGYTTPANGGNFCAMLFSILNYFSYEEDVPYLNHWHHLINADFCDLRRGGTNYMSIYTEDSNSKENILYQKIRQIYTLECDTDPEFDDEAIAFHVDW